MLRLNVILMFAISVIFWPFSGTQSLGQDDFGPGDYDAPPSQQDSYSNGGAQTPGGATKNDADDDNIIRKPKASEPPPQKEFSKVESQKVCNKYNGKLLSVYGEIYKVQNCERHLVQNQEELFKFNKQGFQIVEVESQDLAAIPVGKHWEDVSSKERSCSQLNKRYITFSYTDIYYVENCIKRQLPDYETLLDHRRAHGVKNEDILALTSKEFFSIRQGRDISSIIDKEFSKLLDGSAGVDIIPIDEACKGVEGKIVTFYSRMYKIEKCHKREIDAESFTMHRKGAESKMVELRAEQWLSMPDGKAYTEKK